METRAQQIKRLKDNESHIIFADMTEEDQEYLKSVGRSNCQNLTGDKNSFNPNIDTATRFAESNVLSVTGDLMA